MKKNWLIHYRWFILWSLLLVILSGFPGKALVHLFSWERLFSFDKMAHSLMYLSQEFLLLLAISRHKPAWGPAWTMFVAFTICLCFGSLMELLQSTIFTDRSGEWLDVMANGLGCLMALPLYLLYQRRARLNK